MADSIKIYTNFTNYKNYNERIKGFINFFMAFSNVYLHLTSKSEVSLFRTCPLTGASIAYNSENKSISITLSGLEVSGHIKAKLMKCVLMQEPTEETDVTSPEPVVIDGIHTFSNGTITINNIDPPLEGKHYVLSTTDFSRCVLIPESKLSVSIQSPNSSISERFAILLNENTSSVSDNGKLICDTTFTTHETFLALYKNNGTLTKDPDFSSLPCKIIPYVNGEVNTDETYIPYDAILTEDIVNQLSTPTSSIESVVEIDDNDDFNFNLRTTSFYVKSKLDTSKFYDVYYKMFIASDLDDTKVTNIITQQGISCANSESIALMMIPNFYAEFGFMATGLTNISMSNGNSLTTINALPISLINFTHVNKPVITPYSICVMLCDSETGNAITDISDFDFSKLYITNNIEVQPIDEFFLGIRNHSIDKGHIDSIDPQIMSNINPM